MQAADFLFGAAAQPHDFLHEPLFRILSSGLVTAGITSLALRVCFHIPWGDSRAHVFLCMENVWVWCFSILQSFLLSSKCYSRKRWRVHDGCAIQIVYKRGLYSKHPVQLCCTSGQVVPEYSFELGLMFLCLVTCSWGLAAVTWTAARTRGWRLDSLCLPP